MSILFFDTETTGFPNDRLPISHADQPHICQLAALLCDDDGSIRGGMNFIVLPDGWVIPEKVVAIHGITTEIATRFGISIKGALSIFARMAASADMLVAHNIKFDLQMLEIACARTGVDIELPPAHACTMQKAIDHVKAPPTQRMIDCGMTGYKNPNLAEAYKHFTGDELLGAHDAMNDVTACKDIYFAIKNIEAASK